jgi:peptidyl-prolyl cis-trans isomerase A (cyclophilin A)
MQQMKQIVCLLALACAVATPGVAVEGEGSSEDSGLHPRVKMETSLGAMVIELDGEKAPITTLNFLQYVEDKYYEGTIFHRVVPGFVIQGGGYTAEMELKSEGLRSGIKNEWQNGLKNKQYTLSMARLGGQPDSATSQFFVNLQDNAALDQSRDGAAYAVFGKVVEGMDVVDKIKDTELVSHPKYPGGKVVPKEPVIITSVKLISKFDKSAIEAAAKRLEKEASEAAAKAQAEKEQALKNVIAEAEKAAGKPVTTTDSGLKYVDLKEGEGESPSPADTVTVHYTGWLVDGTKFDSSVDRGEPATFPLSGVIRGWTEGVSSMKVGGKRKLIIPPDLGYGPRGMPPRIPAESWLVFEVELLSIE